MGQYYIIYNLTKRQSVKPAFANWKLLEINWENIIKTMKWESSDELRAYGDYGTVVGYKEGQLTDFEDFTGEENDSHKGVFDQPYEMKYICKWRNIVLDQPYEYEEYAKLANVSQKTN